MFLKFLIYSILLSSKDEWTLWAHSNQAVTSTSPPKMPFQRSPITSHCRLSGSTAYLLSTPPSRIPWSWPLPYPWNIFFLWLPGQPPAHRLHFPPAFLAAPIWSSWLVSPCLPNRLMLQCPWPFNLFSFYIHSPADLTSLMTLILLIIPNIMSPTLTSPYYRMPSKPEWPEML